MTDTITVADNFQLKYTDGSEQKIFMSFALLNRLAGIVPAIDQIQFMFTNPVHREAVLIELLALRNEDGDVLEDPEVLNEKLSLNAALELLEWAGGHLTNFFTQALFRCAKIAKATQSHLNSASTPAGTTA